jgi:heterodisulfide reductase subunit C
MTRPARRTDSEAARAWVRRARCMRCVICGERGPRGHHIITQQLLRRTALSKGLDLEAIRWDQRNLLALCDRHHAAHHAKMPAIALSIVLMHQPKVLAFASELGLVWWLSREYPHLSTRRTRWTRSTR